MLKVITTFIGTLIASEAYAMSPPQGSEGGAGIVGSLLPLVVIFAIFYFLLIRPQSKKQKALQELVSNLRKGDKVITNGGIYGLVESVSDKTVTLKVAENTKIKFGKTYIAIVRSTADEE